MRAVSDHEIWLSVYGAAFALLYREALSRGDRTRVRYIEDDASDVAEAAVKARKANVEEWVRDRTR